MAFKVLYSLVQVANLTSPPAELRHIPTAVLTVSSRTHIQHQVFRPAQNIFPTFFHSSKSDLALRDQVSPPAPMASPFLNPLASILNNH